MTAVAPRVGLFGGTFDPPHRGHRALADTALHALALNELRWLPAGTPWQKTDRELASPEHRAAMVRLAIEDEPRFHLDARELARPGPSYTIDSVRELRAELPDAQLYLIIGQDQYARLHTWHEWRELLGCVTLAVAARNGQAPVPGAALMNFRHRIEVLPMPRIDVSATQVRERATARGDLSALVGAAVAGYIEHQQLYRGIATH